MNLNFKSIRCFTLYLVIGTLLQGCSLFFEKGSGKDLSDKKVILVVIDGARYSETFGDDDHKFIGNIWNKLRPKGTIFTSFFIDSSGQTLTNPGHASMLTGTWQSISNDGEERPTKPTLFEYFCKKKNKDATDTYLVASKAKLDAVSFSNSDEYGESYKASFFGAEEYGNDITTIQKATDVIKNEKPQLLTINLGATDIAGHSGDFDDYTSKLGRADSLIYDFWQLVQRQDYYKDTTNLFITTDHGRHLDGIGTGFQGHGDNCPGCRHLILLALGPQISENKKIDTKYYQIDLANTIGKIMGFSLEYSEGNLIRPIFR